MSFAFSQIDPETSGQVDKLPVPMMDYLGAMTRQGWHDSSFNSIMEMREYSLENGDDHSPMLQPDQANERYGIRGQLQFDEPVRESVAQLRNRRKRDEMDRQLLIDNGQSAARMVPGLAASFVGGVSNPLDLGLMFVPVVGEEAVAEKLAVAGIGGFRQALARGVIPIESIVKSQVPFPKFTAAMIQGVGTQAVFEVPTMLNRWQQGLPYDAGTFAEDVVSAGVLSGALHAGISAASRLLRSIRPETAAAIERQAHNDFLRNQETDLSKYVSVDENMILQKVLAEMDPIHRAAAEEEWLRNAGLVETQVSDKLRAEIQEISARLEEEFRGKTSLISLLKFQDEALLDAVKDPELVKLIDAAISPHNPAELAINDLLANKRSINKTRGSSLKESARIQILDAAVRQSWTAPGWQEIEEYVKHNHPDLHQVNADLREGRGLGNVTQTEEIDRNKREGFAIAQLMERGMDANEARAALADWRHESLRVRELSPALAQWIDVNLMRSLGDNTLRNEGHPGLYGVRDTTKFQEMVQRERDRQVAGAMERLRKDFDPRRRFDELRQAEVDRQIQAGRVLQPEEISKNQHEFDPTSSEDVDKQIADLGVEMRQAGVDVESLIGEFSSKGRDMTFQTAVDCILSKMV